MEGRDPVPGMSPEQYAQAQQLYDVTEQALAEERWRMCCLMAMKANGELLGRAEFELRDHAHRMGAVTLEAAVNERSKKGGTLAAASSAGNASKTPGSSAGGPRRSPV